MNIFALISKGIHFFKQHPLYKGVIAYIFFAMLLYFSINHTFPIMVRYGVLVLFLGIGGSFFKTFLDRFIHLSYWCLYPLSMAFFILSVSLSAGIPLVFYRYSPFIFSLFVSMPFLLRCVVKDSDPNCAPLETGKDDSVPVFRVPVKKMVVAVLISGIVTVLFFFFARTGEHILHPWQVVHPLALWAFAVMTVLVVVVIFSQASLRIAFFLIIVHSLVLHAYLPIVYDSGFGGDRWRHIASERYLLTGEIYEPGLIGEDAISTKKIFSMTIPEVFIAGNKTSYAPQWALTIFFHRVTGISVEDVDQWIVPLLWFWFVPMIMYSIGKVLFQEKRWALLCAFIPSMFFPYQVYGSITIAVGIGQMMFLFIVYFLLQYIHTKNISFAKMSVFLTLLHYFSYILHLFLGGIGVILAGCLGWVYAKKHKAWLYVFCVLCFVLFIILIPLSEYIFGFSTFQFEKLYPQTLVLSAADAFGRLTNIVGYNHYGSYIGEGNFLYEANRLPKSSASFLRWPYWPMILSLIVYGMAGIGWVLALKKKSSRQWKFIALFCGILGASYFISWFLMDGYHTLARRLDLSIALFVGLLFLYGARWIIHRFSFPLLYKERGGGGILTAHNILILFIIGISFVTLSTYASGPILDRVTTDELSAAEYLWAELPSIVSDSNQYCVLANTWPLLAVESVSAREVIGGGFPVYTEYAQPERVKLFEKMSQHPNQKLLERALAVTTAKTCFYMTEYRFINRRVYTETVKLLGAPEKTFGDVLIWRYVSRL